MEITFDSMIPTITPKIVTVFLFPKNLAIEANKENMAKGCEGGYLNATDVADYLVRKGLPFRSAYKISGQIVAECIKKGKVLENLSIEEYKGFSELIDGDVYDAVDLQNCVERRISEGGTSISSVEKQIQYAVEKIQG